MNWESWQAFWAMGGQGFFVWGAYGVAALALFVECLIILRRGRRAAAMRDGGEAP